eukprot:TRINITY_DN4158_c0_g2_i2.p1 TRINITY_DN4158_c0_g2~~TRINITY_DN4158_c0_g2_i2.p1  ORF type:complete len:721 (-),score=209.38 TRINITY_DN4158_c0_g2_i2:1166-3328(-)
MLELCKIFFQFYPIFLQAYYAYYYGGAQLPPQYQTGKPAAPAATPAAAPAPAAAAPAAAARPAGPPAQPGYPPYADPYAAAAAYGGGFGGYPPAASFPGYPPTAYPGYPPGPPGQPPSPYGAPPGPYGMPPGAGPRPGPPGAPGFGGPPPGRPPFPGPGGFGGGGGGGGFGGGFGGQREEASRVVWLGNIHPETSEQELRGAFQRFGMLEGVKVVPQKNCAFVRFINLDDAMTAHQQMTGSWIHGQQIKVGWGKADPAPMQREDIGPPPCRNLWLGNVAEGISEDMIRSGFSRFGHIEKVRIMPTKNCAFVNYSNLDSALAAKNAMQGQEMLGRPLKIGFGREDEGRNNPPKDMGGMGGRFGGGFGGGFGDRAGDRFGDSAAPSIAAPAAASADPFPLAKVDPPPPAFPAPEDPEVQKIIDKLADYVARNGVSFETNMIEKQKGNPKFAFLEGGAHSGYYKFKLWKERHVGIDPEDVLRQIAQARASGLAIAGEKYAAVPPPAALTAGIATSTFSAGSKFSAVPPAPAGLFSGFSNGPPQAASSPADDFSQLTHLIDNLVATKESIKATKTFIMGKPQLARDSARYLLDRVNRAQDFDTRLNVLYLIHDILHHARTKEEPSVGEDLVAAFQPVLGQILRGTYLNQDPSHQEKVTKVVKIWEDKNIFDPVTLRQLELEMRGEAPPARTPRGFSSVPPPEDPSRKRDREDFDIDQFDSKRRF